MKKTGRTIGIIAVITLFWLMAMGSSDTVDKSEKTVKSSSSTTVETEESQVQSSEEKADEPDSEYEKAFVCNGNEYDIYYMFDEDNNIVVYFATWDTYVMTGTFSGDFYDGVDIDWSSVEEGWHETFIYKSGNKATLIDNDNFDSEFEVCDIATAQSALNKILQIGEEEVKEQTTYDQPATDQPDNEEAATSAETTSEDSSTVYSVENCDDLKELIFLDRSSNEHEIRSFAGHYMGKTIKIELLTSFVEKYKNLGTRFNYLLFAVNDENVMLTGPTFLFENVGYYDLHLTGDNKPDSFGIGIHCLVTAEIKGYKDKMILLKPISIEVIKEY